MVIPAAHLPVLAAML